MDPACVHIKHESFDFLGLPGELRNRIYKECIWSQLVPGTDQIRRSNYNNLVAFFTTNKQVRNELMPLVFENVVLCTTDPDTPFAFQVIRSLSNIRDAHLNLQASLTVRDIRREPGCPYTWALETHSDLRYMLISTLCSGCVNNDNEAFERTISDKWTPAFFDLQRKKVEDFTIVRGVPSHLKDKIQRSTARMYHEIRSFREGHNEWTYEASDRSWYIVARYHGNFDVEVVGHIGCLERLWDSRLTRDQERRYRHVTDAPKIAKQLRRKWSLKIQMMGAMSQNQDREAS